LFRYWINSSRTSSQSGSSIRRRAILPRRCAPSLTLWLRSSGHDHVDVPWQL